MVQCSRNADHRGQDKHEKQGQSEGGIGIVQVRVESLSIEGFRGQSETDIFQAEANAEQAIKVALIEHQRQKGHGNCSRAIATIAGLVPSTSCTAAKTPITAKGMNSDTLIEKGAAPERETLKGP